eukprot:scaffold82345_cov38-Tisochrysis_lutea.AAC.1
MRHIWPGHAPCVDLSLHTGLGTEQLCTKINLSWTVLKGAWLTSCGSLQGVPGVQEIMAVAG